MTSLERGQIWNFVRRIGGASERSVEILQFSDLYVSVRNCQTGKMSRIERGRFSEEGDSRRAGYFFSGRTVDEGPNKV